MKCVARVKISLCKSWVGVKTIVAILVDAWQLHSSYLVTDLLTKSPSISIIAGHFILKIFPPLFEQEKEKLID